MDEDTARALATLLDLDLPDETIAGVLQNLAALADHARRLDVPA